MELAKTSITPAQRRTPRTAGRYPPWRKNRSERERERERESVHGEHHLHVPLPDTPPNGGLRLPNVKLRTFTGLREEYEDCKSEWETTQYLYQIPDDKMAGLVYLALAAGPDKARDLLRRLNVREDILQNRGLKELYKILDAEYDKPVYRKSDEAFKQYERQRRKPYQQMEDYVKEFRREKTV